MTGRILEIHKSRIVRIARHACLSVFSLALLIALQFSGGRTAFSAEPQPKRVLILFAAQVVLPTHLDWERGIRAGLQAASISPLEIDVEYADLLRFKDAGYMESFVDLLRHKYSARKIDVIIPVYDPAFDFVEQYGESLFPGAAVVFCSVNQRHLRDKKLGSNVTGVIVRPDFEGTIALAHQLWPQAKRMAVVAGADLAGKRMEAEFREVFTNDAGGLEFKYFSGIPLNELKEQLAQLSSDTPILLLPFVQDSRGNNYTTPEVAAAVSGVARAPVFGLYETLLGHGLVGGHLVSLVEQGRQAGELAMRVLGGQNPSQIAMVGPQPYRYEFDWRELRRWDIPESRLPTGSVVSFREPNFWDSYKWYLISGFGLLIAQSLVIVGLLASRRRRRRAEGALAEHLNFEKSLSTLSARFLQIAPGKMDQTVAQSLREIIAVFGFDRSAVFEFAGDRIELFVTPSHATEQDALPQWHAVDATVWICERILGNEEIRFSTLEDLPPAARREIEYFRRVGINSGIVLPLSVSNSALGGIAFGYFQQNHAWPESIVQRLRLVASVFVRAFARERADREISVNEKRASDLAGRLLTAQEEERRHLARELHDNVTQRLAIAAIEIDKLQRATNAGGETNSPLGRVKQDLVQLSEEIHGISRQLHPQIIEDLGLVAALRVECERFFDRQGIHIRFDPGDISAKLPREIALCLFRVAQEGLWNVAKHAQASEVLLSLRCQANTLYLCIADDGVGFDREAAHGNGGLGMVSMAERVNLFAGKLSIRSQPGHGTELEVELAIPGEAS